MGIDRELLNWLLEENNPSVRLRALIGLCDLSEDHKEVKATRRVVASTLQAASDLSWMSLKGQTVVYNLTALAESGLSRKDVDVEPCVDKLLSAPYFDAGCGELMALRAMVMLGYGKDSRLGKRLSQLAEAQLPDGGWLCLHRVRKMKKVPKSCMRVTMHGLLLAGELKKRELDFSGSGQLIRYFVKRHLFHRTDNPAQVVVKHMDEVFFPVEYFSVGLPLLLDALAALGAGEATELREAWSLLEERKDHHGRLLLEGTLPSNRTYLPKERVGKPSKWGTLYACLASNEKGSLGLGTAKV
jgi:hypothetical protein